MYYFKSVLPFSVLTELESAPYGLGVRWGRNYFSN